MWIAFLIVILALVAIYFGISAGVAWYIAAPSSRHPRRTPANLGAKYEDVCFPSHPDNIMLRGWYLPGGERGTFIVVHGGKQDRADVSMKLLRLCVDLSRQGFNVLTFDRRGCGASDAPHRFLRGHFQRDVVGAIDFVREHYGETRIYLLGVSIGAVATIIGAGIDRRVRGVILDSCFASTREMAERAMRKVNRLLTVFTPGAAFMGRLIYRFPVPHAIDYIGEVNCPIFLIHGEVDRGVPVTDCARLHLASGNSSDEVWVAPAADHGQAYAQYPEEYIKRVVDFTREKCGGD